MPASKPRKLGMTFHRTFPLSRQRLRRVLETAQQGDTSYGVLRENTTFGTGQVKSAQNYAVATGLVDKQAPTAFAQRVMSTDLDMEAPETQWVLHFNMASPYGLAPEFWRYLVNIVFTLGQSWTSKEVAVALADFQAQEGESTEEQAQRAATAFLGTYSQADGLGNLGILRSEGNSYFVEEPSPPPIGAFAYLLARHWDVTWPGRVSVNLDDVSGPDGLAPLLVMNRSNTNGRLSELQSQGLLTLQRKVPPFQVTRLWDSADALLERLYA